MRGLRWVLALACALPALPVAAQPIAAPPISAPPISAPHPLARDAGEYSPAYAVPADEALRRLIAQEESVGFTDALALRHRDRLAGLWIEHRPDYRIVVLLTGDTVPPPETIVTSTMVVPVVYRTGAAATRDAVVAAVAARQEDVRAVLPLVGGIGADPRTGTLVAMVRAADATGEDVDALAAAVAMIAGVPATVRVLGDEANLSVEGGARMEGNASAAPGDLRRFVCTAGFVVTDGVRDGIATAAHCPDAVSYVSPAGERVPLDFAGQWGERDRDVQINLVATPAIAAFHAEDRSAVRPLTGWRNRGSTRSGDYVCHRGERTGYSCAEVELTDYAPAPPLCAGTCDPVWVTVAGPSCRAGDSGGPVFLGGTAFGLLKGGSYRPSGGCSFYYYMSTDFLPPGWSLRHG